MRSEINAGNNKQNTLQDHQAVFWAIWDIEITGRMVIQVPRHQRKSVLS